MGTASTQDTEIEDARQMLLAAGFNPALLDVVECEEGAAHEAAPADLPEPAQTGPITPKEPEPEAAPERPDPNAALHEGVLQSSTCSSIAQESESAEDQELRAELRLVRQNSRNVDEPEIISPTRFQALLQR